jgi:hypothetical protein
LRIENQARRRDGTGDVTTAMSPFGFVFIAWRPTVYSCARMGMTGPGWLVRRMDDELTISVSPERGYVAVSVAGKIDMATAAQFRDQLALVISGGRGEWCSTWRG